MRALSLIQSTDAQDPAHGVDQAIADASERRRHHRRTTHRVWVEVGGSPCWIDDISLGGFQFTQADAVSREEILDTTISGTLVYQDDRAMYRMPFQARVVRFDEESSSVGVAFEPLNDDQIDVLLQVISAIERAVDERRERDARLERRRKWLKYGVAAASGAAVLAVSGIFLVLGS